MDDKIEIFFSYAHKDEELREELEDHLSFLKWEGLTIDWHDRNISAGAEWEFEIDKHLNTAHIILLLVSPAFIASDYCCGVEMKRAMARYEAGEARVIPVILRPVYWRTASFGKLQALPKYKAVTSWPNRDEAFLDVAEGIRKVVMELLQKSQNNPSLPTGTRDALEKPPIGSKNTIDSTDVAKSHSLQTNPKPEPSVLEFEQFRISEPQISTPTLVILLGTTAALAGLELMQQMLSLTQTDRNRVILTFIDTDAPPDLLTEFRQHHEGMFQEIRLLITVPTGLSYVTMVPQSPEEKARATSFQDPKYKKEYFKTLREQHTFIREKIPQFFSNGAGGVRNNGHVAGCFSYPFLYNSLSDALDRFKRLAIEQEVLWTEVQTNIVAFLGGGTGSGILPDIAVAVREILSNRQYKHHINLFCMLPESINGTNLADLKWHISYSPFSPHEEVIHDETTHLPELTDFSWRRSNATACLLELLAFSCAAAGNPRGYYEKYMRTNIQRLSNGPIANEVYLFGQTAMAQVNDIARIVGIDLFQRTTDASGVGFLEHSKWADREMLGAIDDRGLPTMFGTSCPLEVRFSADEMAMAFAQISAAHLLPMLTGYMYMSNPLNVSDAEKDEWSNKWRNIAQFDPNSSNTMGLNLPSEILLDDIRNADKARLNILWGELEEYELFARKWIKHGLKIKRREEIMRIAETSPQGRGSISFFYRQIQRLKRLDEEYVVALDILEEDIPDKVERPVDLERKLTSRSLLSPLTQDKLANEICDQYNERIRMPGKAARHQVLKRLLNELRRLVQDNISHALYMFEVTEGGANSKELEKIGKESSAWQGRLDNPHRHQRHIFDLNTLRTKDGQNRAVERLYRWVTWGDKAVDGEMPIDYSNFVGECIKYLSRHDHTPGDDDQQVASSQRQSVSDFGNRVVSFFRDYYIKQLRGLNLFELLDKASSPSQKGLPPAEQISNYLLAHLRRIMIISNPFPLDLEVWPDSTSNLDTSLYLGIHWRDGSQKAILDQTLEAFSSEKNGGKLPLVAASIDPHRLQVSYGQHGISLSIVGEFSRDINSAMEAYLFHQKEWEVSISSGMPIHASSEAERLVRDPNALGHGVPLPDRIIRRPFSDDKLDDRSSAKSSSTRMELP